MKKTFLIAAAAALTLGTVAVAQDMPAQTPPASTSPDMQAAPAAAPATPDASAMPAPTPAPADSSAAPAAAPTDTSSYPPCGKGMTDKCVQKGGMGHKAWHKKK
ncbi:hypothetical protein [Sphingomonas nostoxanthinifaciens]|uniref:hypothetical protein n=1 Tax=Sphingomonas nostoxanthinifaciens TaxID=2872652 RepID=UPI001CC21100|nr:hypothetical protein [Sphingomonas nostoxanthinifaciens]UAK25120.1 hypothetical protein K8P63_02635 [Sphingomonas nostoxanthinifaciens]